MKNKIYIQKVDSIIEEEIDFLVNNKKVTGFISYAPKKIVVGNDYEVEIDIFINDELSLEEQKELYLDKI